MEFLFEDFFVHYFLNTTNASSIKLHDEIIEYGTDYFLFVCVLIPTIVACLLLAFIIVGHLAEWIDLTCSKRRVKNNN